MLNENYHIAIPTAFFENEELNIDNTINHIQNLYVKGIKSVLVCGSTGEQHSLSIGEKLKLIEALNLHQLTKNMEVIFGVSSVRQTDALILAEAINKTDISGIMLGFPPYIQPTQKEIMTYTKEIMESAKKPTILYNNPSRTGFDLKEETIIELFNTEDSIIGLKEAGQKGEKSISNIKNRCKGIFIYAGGEVNLEFKINIGFNRLSSIGGNVAPIEIRNWFNRFLINKSNPEEDDKIKEILKSIFTEGSAIFNVKYYLNKQGIQMGVCRSPIGNI